MKISVKLKVPCSYDNLKKHLPARYVLMVSNNYYGETVNLVWFSIDKGAITSGEILKAQKRIGNTEIRTLYFARCFTIEASALIAERNGAAFYLNDFPWFDERYHRMRGGTK